MTPELLLRKLGRLIVDAGGEAGGLEMTFGNFDDDGHLINEGVPTVTTDRCEIGAYGNTLYFVFVVFSKTFSARLLEELKKFPNASIYGFKDFKTNLYPAAGFDDHGFLQAIKKDIYLQIQFNHELNQITPETAFVDYQKVGAVLAASGAEIVNQLKTPLD